MAESLIVLMMISNRSDDAVDFSRRSQSPQCRCKIMESSRQMASTVLSSLRQIAKPNGSPTVAPQEEILPVSSEPVGFHQKESRP